MIDEKVQKRMEIESKSIQIRATIENLKHLPFISPEIKAQIDSELPKALPALKEFVKSKLYDLSEKLGTGKDAKTYTLRNGKDGVTLVLWKDMVVTSGVKEMSFPLKTIIDRIDKCDKIETLISEIFSFKLFLPEETNNNNT